MGSIDDIGSFLLGLLWNLLIRFRWSIPAWILLAAHFLFGTPMWLFWFALVIWIGYGVLWTLFIHFVNYCGNSPKVHKENKNPYSAKDDELFSDEK